MKPIDLAWQLLKMPVVDTASGVPVAYGDDVLDIISRNPVFSGGIKSLRSR